MMSLEKLLLTIVFVVVGVKGIAETNGEVCGEDHHMCNQYSDLKIYCTHAVIKQKCKKACGFCKENVTIRTTLPASTVYQQTTVASRDDLAEREQCKPDHPSCRQYTNTKYYCPQRWMKQNCCNHCRRALSADASSSLSNLSYQGRRNQRICRKPDLPMCTQYMQSGKNHYCSHHVIRKHCKKACGMCVDSYSAASISSYSQQSSLSMLSTCPSPDIPMCRYYVDMGKEHYCKQAYMQAYCKKACDMCL